MEPCSSVIDDAEFWLPPEFLAEEDFLVEKESSGLDIDGSLFPYGSRHGFGDFCSTVKPNLRSGEKEGNEDNFLAELTRQMVQASLEDDFCDGFFGNHAFPASNNNKAWGMNRSPPCPGCCCGNQRSNKNCRSRVPSKATWDLCCAAVEEAARMSMDEAYHTGRGFHGPPTKHSSATAVKYHPNNGTGYYNQNKSLPYQKLQAIQFQQLKQMKHHRQLVRQSREGNKNIGLVDLSSSAWSRRPDITRTVVMGDHTGKRGSSGTGVFLPRSVNHTSWAETRNEKPSKFQMSISLGLALSTV